MLEQHRLFHKACEALNQSKDGIMNILLVIGNKTNGKRDCSTSIERAKNSYLSIQAK